MKTKNLTTPGNEFQRLFEKLSIFQAQKAKQLIIERCCITEGTYENWWVGRATPRQACLNTITSTIEEILNS